MHVHTTQRSTDGLQGTCTHQRNAACPTHLHQRRRLGKGLDLCDVILVQRLERVNGGAQGGHGLIQVRLCAVRDFLWCMCVCVRAYVCACVCVRCVCGYGWECAGACMSMHVLEQSLHTAPTTPTATHAPLTRAIATPACRAQWHPAHTWTSRWIFLTSFSSSATFFFTISASCWSADTCVLMHVRTSEGLHACTQGLYWRWLVTNSSSILLSP